MGLGPYGYFRDEFYYLDCAANLDWGYVDQPPLSMLILAVTRLLLGPSIFAIRIPAILAGAATVAVAGLLAREMGGGKFGQALAGLSLIAAPVFLTMSSFFSMNPFDYLFWAIAAYILVRIINTGNARLWLWFGVIAGLGLENKMSMAFFGGLLAIALILTPQRKYYLDWHLWFGGGIALAIFLPNILWQVAHGWPTLEFIHDTTTVPTFLKLNL
jgi:4-amino-4-deoxy-L-arabinose transferase-like glycosyltransferase